MSISNEEKIYTEVKDSLNASVNVIYLLFISLWTWCVYTTPFTWGQTVKICEPFLLPYLLSRGHLLLQVKSFPRFFFSHNRNYRNILHIHPTPRKNQTPSNFSHSKQKKPSKRRRRCDTQALSVEKEWEISILGRRWNTGRHFDKNKKVKYDRVIRNREIVVLK